MKIILGFIAFIITFGFSTTLVGVLFGFPQPSKADYLKTSTRSATAYKIERLLKRDVHTNGARRNNVARRLKASGYSEDLETNSEFRKAVLSYVRKSSSMSDAGLPRDFQYAWRNHMKAWKKQAAYLKSMEMNYDIDSYATRGADSGEINATWDQVLRIARRYGVRIDGSYYQ